MLLGKKVVVDVVVNEAGDAIGAVSAGVGAVAVMPAHQILENDLAAGGRDGVALAIAGAADQFDGLGCGEGLHNAAVRGDYWAAM
jgi:hypothetical protein